MELVWNNPSPNRTIYRAPVWEIIRRNGTGRIISAHEIQAIADRKLDYRAKEVFNDSQVSFLAYFCF